MKQAVLKHIKNTWMLMRFIAVASSSVTTIVSAMLPLFLYGHISNEKLLIIFLLLLFGGVFIHGVLTHILNDHTDHLSGTDQNSPAILSGGSRVIQDGIISAENLWRLGKLLIAAISIGIVFLSVFGFYKVALLLAIGLWSAWSYSLPPLQLSYKPFVGEWLSMFPAVFALGIGGPWIALGTIPEWALQNAAINAFFCNAWVMVHHIPDRDADRAASPKKFTSVVWAADRFGLSFAKFPALLYFGMMACCVLWLGTDRFWAAIGLITISIIAIGMLFKMKVDDHEQVSNYEKLLLLMAMVTGIGLGIFI
ncbi:hypothetical protein JNUCC1_00249 [Lentibacillus sp. JNUCC-1]|uniref:prenyltransferase n=1 Tax=Lentibacillus sp. JNUCC-1 TaxID=2654513 RepID=UPI0012E87EF8|nr:prenyltransferase [Lentibacillus sp. JNUCC-1]MUV36447.1 hypothetical protein [Lentibacillus sp. JNUCC-1]